ncbi:MAG: methyltransferase [Vicinamibacterales bacterium]|jgi:hypothetical protein|nr:methyltransferase [Vicinamibacterales bacterium]HJN43979.1 methyltransferase [Vicinamibacterales bacterium]
MSTAEQPPPDAQLMQMLFGFMASRSVSAVTALDVPDALKDGPRSVEDLAQTVGAHQDSLRRVMRTLVSIGVFAEPEPGTYALTPVSELLRSDATPSMRDMAVLITAQSHWQPWGRFADTLKTGKSGSQHAFGTDAFSWFQQSENKPEWELFNAAMTSFSSGTSMAVVEAYDFSRFTTIADIGGGHGFLLKTVLSKAPEARGVLFDLPGAVEGADRASLGERVECVSGSFFETVPEGADCYTLKHIIHDWDDERCRTILSHIATAMAPSGRVLVVETVMPDGPEPHPAKLMDLNMLAMTEGGTERTRDEFAAVFASAGLELVEIHPTESPVSIVEAKKA